MTETVGDKFLWILLLFSNAFILSFKQNIYIPYYFTLTTICPDNDTGLGQAVVKSLLYRIVDLILFAPSTYCNSHDRGLHQSPPGKSH